MPRPIGAVGMPVIVQFRELSPSSQQMCTSLSDLGADIGPCPRKNFLSPYSNHRCETTLFLWDCHYGNCQALFVTFWIMPSFFVQLLPNHFFDGKGNWPWLVRLRNCVFPVHSQIVLHVSSASFELSGFAGINFVVTMPV